MAWNPRSLGLAFVTLVFFVAIGGCEPAKKPGDADKQKPSSETSQTESTPKAEEVTPEPTKKIEEPAKEPTPEPSAETPAQPKDETPPPVPEAKTKEPVKTAAKEKRPLPPSAATPKVFLTEELRATCLVNVGDAMPQGEFTLDDKEVSLESLYGDTLTVVFFWTSGPRAPLVELFADMQKDVLEPYEAKGLKVVAIKVGDKPEDMKEIMEKSGAKFPAVEDPASQYFNTVAKGNLPRVYLLDASGKILWFDIGYARATRRDLQTAIKAVLDAK